MDFFRFRSSTSDATVLERGEMIQGYNKATWIERYSEAGEFEIECQVSSGLLDLLPAGTFISHIDTMEVMIVENTEIDETTSEDPVLTITGRSFVSYLENRIVGVNQAKSSSKLVAYTIAADYTYNQAVKLIRDHIITPTDSNDGLVNIDASTSVSGTTGVQEARNLNRGTVYDRLLEILAVDDLGVKTVRRNTFSGFGGNNTKTYISIYKGVDRSNQVRFSWKSGDLDQLKLLTSSRKLKNSALVLGRYIYVSVDTGPTLYNRRIMLVDANDIDGDQEVSPTGTALAWITAAMNIRGKEALKKQVNINVSQTDISDLNKYRYRVDYKLGDLIMLDANYGQTAVMRVTEYAEIQDENGESGHPTLTLPIDIT